MDLVMKIRSGVYNVLCHGPWLCSGPEAARGAGGPSLALVPAVLEFQVCSEVRERCEVLWRTLPWRIASKML